MSWWRNLLGGGNLTSFTPSTVNPLFQAGNVPVSMGGSGMHPGMETGYQPVYGVTNKIPQDISMSRGDPLLGGISNPRYSSVISTSTGAPDRSSWWDDFNSGLDRDFIAAAANSLGGGVARYGGRGGGGGVGRAGGRYGSNIRPSEPVAAGMPVPGTAPNPSFATGLVLPRRRQEQYSGGY